MLTKEDKVQIALGTMKICHECKKVPVRLCFDVCWDCYGEAHMFTAPELIKTKEEQIKQMDIYLANKRR